MHSAENVVSRQVGTSERLEESRRVLPHSIHVPFDCFFAVEFTFKLLFLAAFRGPVFLAAVFFAFVFFQSFAVCGLVFGGFGGFGRFGRFGRFRRFGVFGRFRVFRGFGSAGSVFALQPGRSMLSSRRLRCMRGLISLVLVFCRVAVPLRTTEDLSDVGVLHIASLIDSEMDQEFTVKLHNIIKSCLVQFRPSSLVEFFFSFIFWISTSICP